MKRGGCREKNRTKIDSDSGRTRYIELVISRIRAIRFDPRRSPFFFPFFFFSFRKSTRKIENFFYKYSLDHERYNLHTWNLLIYPLPRYHKSICISINREPFCFCLKNILSTVFIEKKKKERRRK